MTHILKWTALLLLIGMLSCNSLPKTAYYETPAPAPPTPLLQQPTPETSTAPADKFKVNVWVNNSAPAPGEQVIAYGSLIKNGVLLGGIMMQGTWVDESHEPGTPNCFVLVTYGRGVCVIETSQFPVGRYVPITIRFDYQNKSFTGSTGFTPRR